MIGTIWLFWGNEPKTPLPDYSNPDSAIAAICAGQVQPVHSSQSSHSVRSSQSSKFSTSHKYECEKLDMSEKDGRAKSTHKYADDYCPVQSSQAVVNSSFPVLGSGPTSAAKVSVPMVRGSAAANVAYGRCNTQTHADSSKHLANSLLDLQSRTNLHQ